MSNTSSPWQKQLQQVIETIQEELGVEVSQEELEKAAQQQNEPTR